MSNKPPTGYFVALAGQRYMNLTTFRKSGAPISTTVWFAQAGDTLYVYTGAASGKVKRIRNNPAVTVAPSTARGVARGPVVAARARLIDGAEAERAHTLVAARYGWQMRLIMLLNKLRRTIGSPAYIAISPPQA